MSENSQIQDKYPYLSAINSPADLRRLPVADLPGVCDEIRRFLISSLSENPGHFASSMGAVEITVAMHYVFDTPYDRIVWDVGHQAYGHKILTERREAFAKTNRTMGGISGFPDPAESPYDTFTAGHASNSISAALGMAVASQLKGETPRRNVVAVIGDASISGGLAFEGINNAANMPNNLLIILNDNDMSIDSNVGSLNSYLAHLTASRTYNNIRYKTYKFFKRHQMVDEQKRGRMLRFNNSLKSLISNQQNIFEGLNIRYFGPFDGHDVCKLVRILTDIRDMEGPRLLHLRTIKGKGYRPAEINPAAWHAPGRFNAKTGERYCDRPGSVPAPLKYQDVFGNALLELAKADKRIVAITAAMLSGTSVGTVQKELPERVFDVGISEGHAVTFAGGLAKDGMRPVVGIYSSFLQRAFDSVIHDVAIQKLPVVFCIDRAGLVGEDGVTHHGSFDLSYMRMIPNMIVSAPSDSVMLRNLLYTALNQDSAPFAIRYPRGRGGMSEPFPAMESMSIGRGRRITAGSQVAVLTIGTIAAEAAEAVAWLRAEGIDAAHYDMIFLKPIDTSILDEVGMSGIPVVTVEDGTVKGGLGSAVLEYFAEKCYRNPVHVLGIPDNFVKHGSVSQLKQLCGIDAETIYLTASKILQK